MEQKAKLIIVGLIGVTVICLFLFIQALGVKQQLTRERDDLKDENTSLTAKMDKLANNLRAYEEKIKSLNSDLDRVSQEKAELDKKYELTNKAREELVEKLKAKKQEQSEASDRSSQSFIPRTDDTYWAGILKAKTDLELQLGNVRSELKNLQINNEQLQRDRSTLELELNNLKRDRADLSRQLDYNKKLLDSIAQELVREKNDKAQIQNSYKTIHNENSILSRQLASLNTRKVNLERNLQELKEDRNSLKRRISEMETMLTEKLGQINGLKDRIESVKSGVPVEGKNESIELPAIVVKPQPGVPGGQDESGATLMGRVLAVNKDNNFVIIDLGDEAGIKVGDALRVYRADKPIANIEAIQVRGNISACDIKKQGTPIKIGDIVR
jgi:chromosome segregation ATPase